MNAFTQGDPGTSDADGKQVLVTADIPLSKRRISGKVCPVRELAIWWDVECFREVPTTYAINPPTGGIEKRERLFLFTKPDPPLCN